MESMGQAGVLAYGGGLLTGTEDEITYTCKRCQTCFAATEQPSRCPGCDARGLWRDFPSVEASRIAAQNDLFRSSLGRVARIAGRIVMTPGVSALMEDHGPEILLKLRQFDAFSGDNDPRGERDFGTITVSSPRGDHRIYWKIDLYDLDYELGSEAPSDPNQTRRVLTLLLPSEY